MKTTNKQRTNRGLRVKTSIKAGATSLCTLRGGCNPDDLNHNETIVKAESDLIE
jgi:hypothetical protein